MGVGLLEILLVLAIMAALATMVGMQYTKLSHHRDSKIIEESASLLGQALNEYFYANCASGLQSKVDYDQVLSFLSPQQQTNIRNPWAQDQSQPYTVSIVATPDADGGDTYNLEVAANMKWSANVVANLVSNLHAAYASGQELTWSWSPSQHPKMVDNSLWVMNSGLANFKQYYVGDSGLNTACIAGNPQGNG